MYKLAPCDKLEREALKTWFDSVGFSIIALRFFLERMYGIDAVTFSDSIEAFVKVNPHPFAWNILVAKNSWNQNHHIYPKMLFRKPSNALLAARVYLLISASKTDGFDQDMLRNASRVLAEHIGIRRLYFNSHDMRENWRSIKQFVVRNYFDPFSPVQISIEKQVSNFIRNKKND
jgi:hypothetical protein